MSFVKSMPTLNDLATAQVRVPRYVISGWGVPRFDE